MILWIVSATSFVFGLRGILPKLLWFLSDLKHYEVHSLQKLLMNLKEIEESFMSGLLPREERWTDLQEGVKPWGPLSYNTLKQLRNRGASVVPTARRLRELVELHLTASLESRNKTRQTYAQAFLCTLLVPVFNFILFQLLPELKAVAWTWFFIGCIGLLLSLIGSLWIIRIELRAQWGGLTGVNENWRVVAPCFGEYLLALICSGHPPDLAWAEAYAQLSPEAPLLLNHWGALVWNPIREINPNRSKSEKRNLNYLLLEYGLGLRKSIQSCLIEGIPCKERVEVILTALRREIKSVVDQELALVGLRCLKPLFLLIAPPLVAMVLLAFLFSIQALELGEK